MMKPPTDTRTNIIIKIIITENQLCINQKRLNTCCWSINVLKLNDKGTSFSLALFSRTCNPALKKNFLSTLQFVIHNSNIYTK